MMGAGGPAKQNKTGSRNFNEKQTQKEDITSKLRGGRGFRRKNRAAGSRN